MPLISGSYFWNEEVTRKLSKSPTALKYSLTLTKVTVEEALDSVVRAFPGVWVHYECPGRINLTSHPVASHNSVQK